MVARARASGCQSRRMVLRVREKEVSGSTTNTSRYFATHTDEIGFRVG